MGALSPILRKLEGDQIAFWCPGCDCMHSIVAGRWTWNGDALRPTFSPSILVRFGRLTNAGAAAHRAWYDAGMPEQVPRFEREDVVCHSYVRDGQIQFLSDCTHALAGRTVPIPEFE